MQEMSFRGGARIGWVNASRPFAKLTVDAQQLKLSSLGTYVFSPSDVVALERYGSIPLFSSGIRIKHNRADYPEKVIFWCMGGRDSVLAELARAGFAPAGQTVPRPSGGPIRWSVIIFAVVIWNALFLLDSTVPRSRHEPGPSSWIALLLLFAAASAVRASPRLQSLVLRDGHQVGEIQSFLILLQIVSGLLCAIFGIMLLAAGGGG